MRVFWCWYLYYSYKPVLFYAAKNWSRKSWDSLAIKNVISKALSTRYLQIKKCIAAFSKILKINMKAEKKVRKNCQKFQNRYQVSHPLLSGYSLNTLVRGKSSSILLATWWLPRRHENVHKESSRSRGDKIWQILTRRPSKGNVKKKISSKFSNFTFILTWNSNSIGVRSIIKILDQDYLQTHFWDLIELS